MLPDNPFATLDVDGVGKIMRMAVELGQGVRPDLEIGICGEHGGDPRSVEFCHKTGLDYVSCSPFRVPVARLAAVQAAVKDAGWRPMPAAPRDAFRQEEAADAAKGETIASSKDAKG